MKRRGTGWCVWPSGTLMWWQSHQGPCKTVHKERVNSCHPTLPPLWIVYMAQCNQVAVEGLNHVSGESCAGVIHIVLPEARRGLKCGQGSLFTVLHYKVSNNHRHQRSHWSTVYLSIHLPSKGQEGCIKTQCLNAFLEAPMKYSSCTSPLSPSLGL